MHGHVIFIITHVDLITGPRGCDFGGTHLAFAQGLRGVDGCTLWSCSSSGMIRNVQRCPNSPPSTTDLMQCNYQGVNYAFADTFFHQNHCDECVCTEHAVECSALAKCTTTPDGCWYHGHHYNTGQQFSQSDGCNACTCTMDGLQCTNNPCGTVTHTQPPVTTEQPYCTHNGQRLNVGDTFMADHQGCTRCTCTIHGMDCFDHCTDSSSATPPASSATSGPLSTTKGSDCKVNGLHVPDGQKFYATDHCNICTCYNGFSECESSPRCTTTQAPTASSQCHMAGNVYNDGDVIPISPSCYHCICKNGDNHCVNHCG